MRVLITGAGGFIGSHLVNDQLRRGRFVTAVDLNVSRLEPLIGSPGLRVLAGDFTDRRFLDPYLEGHAMCFHLASAHLETGVDENYFWKINVQGARDLVERACQARIGRFVHCSSVGVYGDIKRPPATEEDPCHPDIAYERTKLAGEQAVRDFDRQHGYSVVIVRPAWVYGPGCPRTLRLFRAIRKGRFFFVGSGQTLRHPIHVDDMVEGFEIAATHARAPGQVFIMAGPRAVTLVELTSEIASCLGVAPPRVKLPQAPVWFGCFLLELAYRALGKEAPFSRRSLKFFSGNTAFCTEKAANLLNFRASVDLREGLERTYGTIAALVG
jgi:nucleoside-diphosphate-sugar epimerase